MLLEAYYPFILLYFIAKNAPITKNKTINETIKNHVIGPAHNLIKNMKINAKTKAIPAQARTSGQVTFKS